MKTSLPEGVHTYAGRLASFSITYRLPRKARTSSANSKSQILLAWPHQRPSPEQLAQAGFYYRPSPESPDSVECFLCRKGLDGWEEDDDPVQEHLKHSADCGWAVNAYIEQKSEEQKRDDNCDPLSVSIMAARRATFADRWPHENKKGWLCKITKMIESGWYYCPSPESDDFVSCAYCGLSLDGWEPRDNPMEEHQRRSPVCPFFATTTQPQLTAGGKTTRAKKGRASKLSLASTQSANWTTFSANSSFADVPVEEGDSIMSTAMRLATKGKKATTTRGKNTRAKRNEPTELSSFVEPEDDSFDVKVLEKPTRATRGKKRSSAEMDADGHKGERQGSMDTVTEAPPAKRRTRTRSSLAQTQNFPLTAPAVAPQDVVMTGADDATHAAAKRGGKGKRTRNSNAKPRGRKVSAASTASMASMRMEVDVPDDDELDRALEADLDRPLTDDEADDIETEEVPKKRRLTRSRHPSAKVVASVAPVGRATRASKMVNEDIEMGEAAAGVMASETQPEPLPKPTAPKGKQTRKTSAKQKPEPRSKPNPAEETRLGGQAGTLEESKMQERADERLLLDSSVIGDVTSPPPITRPKRVTNRKPSRQMVKRSTRASVMSTTDNHTLPSPQTDRLDLDADSNPGYESADSMASQATVRKGGARQRGTTGKKGKGVKNGEMDSRHIEDIVQGYIETASELKKDEVVEEVRPKRGKKGDTNVSTRKAEDPQVDVDMVDASMEATARAAKPLPDIPTVKAANGRGARKGAAQTAKPLPDVPAVEASKGKVAHKETVVEKVNSTSPDKVEQVEATAMAPARDGTTLASAAVPAEPPRPKAAKGKTSTSAKAKATPSSPRTMATPPIEGNQRGQQGQREERQQVTPDPSNASDAENQPPSSQPPASTPFGSHTTRIPLAASTPVRSSPSKHNGIASLQTSFPWSTVDLETVFLPSPTSTRPGGDHEDADKENRGIRMPLDVMKGLTSPEKKMTVGEWIEFNAKKEEERLRTECERLVGIFEMKGNLAMRALEGIEVVE